MDAKRKTAAALAAAWLILGLSQFGCVKILSKPILLPSEQLAPAPVIVVLGYGPPVDEAGKPNPELYRRVKKGVELYQAGLAPVLIMTGGNTYRDYFESAVMKEVAVGMGVPAEAVIEERQAMDTIGNARYSAQIMRSHGWDRCIIVSSPYHLQRAKKLFAAAGLSVETAAAEVPPGAGYALTFTFYEYMVRVNYWFIDEEALVRGEQGDRRTDRIRGPVRARSSATP